MKWISLILILLLSACGTTPQQAESAHLHLQLADSLIEKENYPSALKELLIAQDLEPSNAIVQSHLGYIYFSRERYDLSEDHYKRAISLNPDFTEAKNNLARVYIETAQNKKAETLLKEVLTDYTYNDFPRAYANYGILEFNRKKYKTALAYFRKTLEKDRENCFAQVYVGRCYMEMGDPKHAADQLNKAVNFCQPLQIDEAHYYGAIALFRSNQKDLATLRFEELLKVFPSGKNRENARKMLDVIKKGKL
jgi:type IV pilus assembly protein PilF